MFYSRKFLYSLGSTRKSVENLTVSKDLNNLVKHTLKNLKVHKINILA